MKVCVPQTIPHRDDWNGRKKKERQYLQNIDGYGCDGAPCSIPCFVKRNFPIHNSPLLYLCGGCSHFLVTIKFQIE